MNKMNEIFNATVRDLSSEGNGVVEHPSGKTFFVPGVWRGEQGEFRITGFKGRYGFAELVMLTQASTARTEAPCIHHGFSAGQCGGCPWQFVSYQAQLEAKQKRVEDSLSRLEKAPSEKIKKIWESPKTSGYRNRAQLKTDGEKIGYVSLSTNRIAAIDDCLILNEKNRNTLQQLLKTLPRKDFRPTNRKRRDKRQWQTLDIDDQTSADTVEPGKRKPFRQGNSEQNERMRVWLRERLSALFKQKKSTAQVVELFAGSGNFTEIISDVGFRNILAVEGSEQLMAALLDKRYPGVETLVSNLFLAESVEKIFAKRDTEILIMDPPRDGLKGKEGLFVDNKKLSDIFYISCNLATFSRDVEYCYQHGFVLAEIQPLDQFPHTPHIELLAHLVRG
ncbi:MAG: class I SAM-dependent RNA methyltransferase [Porticoccaceae bacterium]